MSQTILKRETQTGRRKQPTPKRQPTPTPPHTARTSTVHNEMNVDRQRRKKHSRQAGSPEMRAPRRLTGDQPYRVSNRTRRSPADLARASERLARIRRRQSKQLASKKSCKSVEANVHKIRKSAAHNCHASMYHVYRSKGTQDRPATSDAATGKVEETIRAA